MSYQKAIDDLQSFANKVQGILSVAEFLKNVGNIEQTIQESKLRKEEAVRAESEAKAKQASSEKILDEIHSKIAEINAQQDELIDMTKKKSEEILVDAKFKASKILEEAKFKFDEALKKQMECKKSLDSMDSQVQSKKDELKSIQKQILDLKSKMVDFVK